MPVNSNTCDAPFRFGPWLAEPAAGEVSGPGGRQRLEPKVMDLLCVLAARPGEVLSRETLMEALWPGVVVGDDSLARTVSKLRQALGDDARSPAFVETIAKRGYRWLPDVSPVEAAAAAPSSPGAPPEGKAAADAGRKKAWRLPLALGLAAVAVVGVAVFWPGRDPVAPGPAAGPGAPEAQALLARADDYYFQFSRADNEAALELYQRVLSRDPENADAMAGLANALAQRAIRWPTAPGPDAVQFSRLGDALAAGYLQREPGRSQLQRARQLAEAAVAQVPASAGAHKALGLVASAQGELETALAAHRRAVELDPAAWGAMVNIADVLGLMGRDEEALPWFERAFEAMATDYANNPAKVRDWQAQLGVVVADEHRARGDAGRAEAWYRRVLGIQPLQPDATRGLAAVLAAGGDAAAAERLCLELAQRVGEAGECPAP